MVLNIRCVEVVFKCLIEDCANARAEESVYCKKCDMEMAGRAAEACMQIILGEI